MLVRARADGLEGVAAGLSRGEPTAREVSRLAPLALGRTPEEVADLTNKIGAASPLVVRAVSLLDIAAWDLRARAAGLPLYRLLGGRPDPMPLIVYGGFEPDFERELSEYASAGARAVKLARQPADAEKEAARLARARSALGEGPGLVLDGGWTWNSVEEVEPYARAYEPYRLLWLEDPFPPHSGALLAELRTRTSLPLAAGDEWCDEPAFDEALAGGGLDVCRIDATVAGGVSGYLRIAALAHAAGRVTSAHMHDYLHVHLQSATGGGWVERSDPESGVDPLDRIFRTTSMPVDGMFAPPEAPGLGVEVDWKGVAALAER